MVSGTSYQQTRDNLNKKDNTRDIVLIGVFQEEILTEEQPTILKSRVLTGQGIWGIGFGDGTDSDGVWGETGYVWQSAPHTGDYTYRRVVNPQNIFRERFRYDTFNDSTNTTATFSTTYYNVAFDKGDVWQTLQIFKNEESIRSATIHATISGGDTEFTVSDVDVEEVKTITIGQ